MLYARLSRSANGEYDYYEVDEVDCSVDEYLERSNDGAPLGQYTEVCPADQAPIVHRRNGAIVLRTWIPPTDQMDGRWIYDALWTD